VGNNCSVVLIDEIIMDYLEVAVRVYEYLF
jgi:hypothetical protein